MKTLLLTLLLAISPVVVTAQNPPVPAAQAPTFTNPLLSSGPDPWVTSKDGFYYYMNTVGANLSIWKTRSLADLSTAESKVVYTPPPGQPYSRELWAPELHWLRGRWYIYFAADPGNNRDHRLWVISSDSADPLAGTWTEPKALKTPDDRWAIDATVFENKGQLYLVWSGWKGADNLMQRIYIARLRDPETVEGPRAEISHPSLKWETVGDLPSGDHVDVNEGPEVIRHGNELLLTYSASGCWTDSYALGEMTASVDSDLMNPKSWHKVKRPVLTTSAAAEAFGPGHNSFFKSPDGTEDWILYHANPHAHQGCGNDRSPRMQPFRWNADGTADFGPPVPLDHPLPRPSGDGTKPPNGE